ncbi:MAG: hypothetical protein ACK4OP_18605, partial [Gemmobacter sp.]
HPFRAAAGPPAGDTTSRIVVIARDIPRADLAASLAVLRMQPAPDESADGITMQTLEMPF